MREIYNEGRVVGYNQYELYLRNILARNPNASILTERQWLSASLSSNMSMILRIKAGTTRGVHDYLLPEYSDLCGCTVIFGSIFEGKPNFGEDDDSDWAVRIDDYGRLVQNDVDKNPVTPGMPEDVPTKDDPISLGDFAKQCKEYIKVTGALMFQPGEWIDNVYYTGLLTQDGDQILTQDGRQLNVPQTNYEAEKSLDPDLSKPGFIRLAINSDIENEFYILFHGFSYKSLVEGEVGYNYIPDIGSPANGDFLGPGSFPWGCPITLTVSTTVLRAFMEGIDPDIPTPLPEWVTEWNPSWKDI